MNEESKTQHCGDTCSVVASMASAFKTYVPKEQRMTEAIKAVQSGKMSQRAAAEKFDIPRRTLGDRLKQVGETAHPETSQSQPQKQAEPTRQRSAAEEDKLRRAGEIRNLARAHDMNRIDGKFVRDIGAVAIHDALIAAGIDVPDDIKPRSLLPKQSKPPKSLAPVPVKSHEPEPQPFPEDSSIHFDTDDDDELLAERINLERLNEQTLNELLRTDRAESLKQASKLANQLEKIVTQAFYGKDNWTGQDWIYINSQIKTIQSLTGQQAEEAHSEFLQRLHAETHTVDL